MAKLINDSHNINLHKQEEKCQVVDDPLNKSFDGEEMK